VRRHPPLQELVEEMDYCLNILWNDKNVGVALDQVFSKVWLQNSLSWQEAHLH
jgi:hypothetical protein